MDTSPPMTAPDADTPDFAAPADALGASAAGVDAAGVDAAGAAAPDGALSEDQVKLALRKVKDPELNLNIVDLGLIYDIKVDGANVAIDMSLTSPGCPSGPEIMGHADEAIKKLPGVGEVSVNLVWTPPWSPERIEPRVRAYLGF
jgi:metal-sulfur cluster biosynthetic enzyme